MLKDVKNFEKNQQKDGDLELTGLDLLERLVSATGLPKEAAMQDMITSVKSCGKSVNSLTLDDLRAVMTNYLDQVQADILSSEKTSEDPHESADGDLEEGVTKKVFIETEPRH